MADWADSSSKVVEMKAKKADVKYLRVCNVYCRNRPLDKVAIINAKTNGLICYLNMPPGKSFWYWGVDRMIQIMNHHGFVLDRGPSWHV